MIPLDDCCYHCGFCGLATCRDERPSPLEEQLICADCAPVSDGLAAAMGAAS